MALDPSDHDAIRGQDNPQTPATELILSHSRREGEQLSVNLNRELLAKAVQLGFGEVHFINPNTPALCIDKRRKISLPCSPDRVQFEPSAATAN